MNTGPGLYKVPGAQRSTIEKTLRAEVAMLCIEEQKIPTNHITHHIALVCTILLLLSAYAHTVVQI